MEGQQELVGELLPPEINTGEAVDTAALVPLEIKTPLQQWKDLFIKMTQVRQQAILWESKTKITDIKTRDEAIALRTYVTRLKTKIEEVRKAMQAPVADYIKEMNQYAKDAYLPLAGEKADDPQGVAGRLTKKINDFAAWQAAEEARIKKEALARQKMIEDEIEAHRLEREMEEQRQRQEEEKRLADLHAETLKKAQAEGHVETDLMMADIAMEQEQAKIDADRAQREKAEKDRKAAEEATKDAAQQATVNTMATATAAGRVKGVKKIWVIEAIAGKEKEVPRQFCMPDETKIRKYVESEVSDETDAEKIVPGYRCYVALGKGGR